MPLSPQHFAEADRAAIGAALRYWLAKWDWECPTLFGLKQAEVQQVLDRWPDDVDCGEPTAALAITAAFRELLHGASAVQRASVPKACGLSYEAANDLSQRIHLYVRHALQREA